MSGVRNRLNLSFNGEEKELLITFDFIDRIRRKVPWEKLALDLSGQGGEVIPDFTLMARFVYHNLKEAGFLVNEDDLNDIYDDMLSSGVAQQAYINLIAQILGSYQPNGKKKTKAKRPQIVIKKQ
jgi:hypothetical protein